jgi:hypothetical protein
MPEEIFLFSLEYIPIFFRIYSLLLCLAEIMFINEGGGAGGAGGYGETVDKKKSKENKQTSDR